MDRLSTTVPKIQRKDEILRALYEKGHLEIREISTRFGVSEATVRRDLRRLADDGHLELVYGGATIPRKNSYSIQSRQTRDIEAKRIIGKLAAALVRNGDAIFLDSGTTCACLVPHLLARNNLKVITNSNLLAAQLGEQTDFEVIQLGGRFRFERMDSVGPFAQMMMEQLSGYRAFVGADGISLDFGLTCTDIETAHLYRSVIHHASETTLVADHTKFSAPTLYKMVGIEAINRLVTDRPISPEWNDVLERNGIDIIFPGQTNGNGALFTDGETIPDK